MINFKDYENEVGEVDWESYHEAQRQAGGKCTQCGDLMIPYTGKDSQGPRKCFDCNEIENYDNKLSLSSRVRCPKCRYSWNPLEDCEDDCYEEGEHTVYCDDCGYEFEINTHVEITFDSPAMLKGKE